MLKQTCAIIKYKDIDMKKSKLETLKCKKLGVFAPSLKPSIGSSIISLESSYKAFM